MCYPLSLIFGGIELDDDGLRRRRVGLHRLLPPRLGHFLEDGDVSFLPAGHFVAILERPHGILVDPRVQRFWTKKLKSKDKYVEYAD